MTFNQRENLVMFLSRFNIDTIQELRGWSDNRLRQGVQLIKTELKRKGK